MQPAEAESPNRPGITNDCLPCSSTAILAVMRAPLRRAASTTSIADDKPETILFRLGKYAGRGER